MPKYLVDVEVYHTFTQTISETIEVEAGSKEEAEALATTEASAFDYDYYEAEYDDTDVNIIKIVSFDPARCKKTPDMFEV